MKQKRPFTKVSVQGVESLGGHFATLCRGFDFYEVKKNSVFFFQKEKKNIFYHFYSEKTSKREK